MGQQPDPQLVLRCNEVSDFTEKAAKDGGLLTTLEALRPKLNIYAFKSRFKGANNILKKVRRKREEGRRLLGTLRALRKEIRGRDDKDLEDYQSLRRLKHEIQYADALTKYNPDHVTDAWGCRFVTLYQTEIPVTVATLLAELHSFNNGDNGSPVRLKEFVIYTNRPDQDPLSIVSSAREALERSGFKDHASTIREPENRKSAYSSVHLVFDRDVDIEHIGEDQTTELAKFEIQIRDIFEEGWGEIQHHLLYSEKESFPDRVEGLLSDESSNETWRSHLNALKTFVDGCSQHASIIRREFDESRRVPATTPATQSVTNRSDDQRWVVQELKRLAAPQAAIEAISNGYTLLRSGDEAQLPREKLGRFCQAAASFAHALTQLRKRDKEALTAAKRPIQYYVTMELANSQVAGAEASTRLDRPQRKLERALYTSARDSYHAMSKLIETDAVSRIRLSKVLEKLAVSNDELLAALKVSEQAIALLGSDDVVSPAHWIAITARIDKGFILWRMAQNEKSEDVPEALNLIKRAADANLRALASWGKQPEIQRLKESNRLAAHKAASNLLFFGGKLIEGGRTNKQINPEKLREWIRFIGKLDIESHADYFKTRDNFLHAYRALGDIDAARAAADANFRELRDLAEARSRRPLLDIPSLVKFLRGSEARCFQTAQRFLFQHGG